jgi:hypothetical protein
MGPNNDIRRGLPNSSDSPSSPSRNLNPQQTGPRHQRSMEGFGPRPVMQSKPSNNLRAPQPLHRPMHPRPAHHPNQPQIAHRPQVSTPEPAKILSFEPPKKPKKSIKKFILNKTSLIILAVILVGLAGAFVGFKHSSGKSEAAVKNAQPSIRPMEKPSFTVYFPSNMPEGLKASKESISYYKESFTFILEQSGKKSFFVYEQPASTDPDFSSLKSRIVAPHDISLSVGHGIEGTLDAGTVTAVKTDKNTLLIVNCTKNVCSTMPRDILSNMQVSSDLEALRRANL